LASTLQKAVVQCRTAQENLNKCTDTVSCQHASLDLTRCLGKLWCPLQHDALLMALLGEGGATTNNKSNKNNAPANDDDIEIALERLSHCVGSAHQRASQARKEYPSIFGEKPGPA
jgi:hypothetical protein